MALLEPVADVLAVDGDLAEELEPELGLYDGDGRHLELGLVAARDLVNFDDHPLVCRGQRCARGNASLLLSTERRMQGFGSGRGHEIARHLIGVRILLVLHAWILSLTRVAIRASSHLR